jgi:fructan beta-fructosidase
MLAVAAVALLLAADRPDVLVNDFEADTYGPWTATGTAFGPGPAAGTLPGQMAVSGYLGKRLVNSFAGGDAATGTLTSPPVRIERNYVNFLVGGGKFPGKTCVNLRVDGKVVRTATGPNDRPGGSEALDWHTWDVAEFAGKEAVFEIVDAATGGWGHVNVDHIVQSDRRREAGPVRRTFAIDKRYLHLPVRTGAAKRRVTLSVGGAVVREFEIELADGTPEFWAFADVEAFRGKELTVETRLPDPAGLDALTLADAVPNADGQYREANRPLVHFTSRVGWLNDPNGLVFDGRRFHLFYQHNPFGREWGNMHWGHAVSADLVRWEERPEAVYPRRFGDWAFSGSAVLDRGNTSGFGTTENPPLVAAFTSTGRGECVLFSTDGGDTWREFEGNPVVKHRGRDPKLVWHAPTRRWVMAVYDEGADGKARDIAFYTSPDLKAWAYRSRVGGFFECPDLFELPIDGDAKRTKWVLSAADGKYLLGTFDGERFTADGGKHQLWHGNFYAAQTFDNAPDSRRVQIGWGQGITFPGTPFNQQMTVPVELTLRTTPAGPRLFAEPVRELDTLAGGESWGLDRVTVTGNAGLGRVRGEAIDARGTFTLAGAERVGFDLRGVPVVYDVAKRELRVAGKTFPLTPAGDTLHLRALLDRGSVEAFADGGAVAVSLAVRPAGELSGLATAGRTTVTGMRIVGLKSAWGR